MQYLESGIYIACSRLQDSGEEAHREKLHENWQMGCFAAYFGLSKFIAKLTNENHRIYGDS